MENRSLSLCYSEIWALQDLTCPQNGVFFQLQKVSSRQCDKQIRHFWALWIENHQGDHILIFMNFEFWWPMYRKSGSRQKKIKSRKSWKIMKNRKCSPDIVLCIESKMSEFRPRIVKLWPVQHVKNDVLAVHLKLKTLITHCRSGFHNSSTVHSFEVEFYKHVCYCSRTRHRQGNLSKMILHNPKWGFTFSGFTTCNCSALETQQLQLQCQRIDQLIKVRNRVDYEWLLPTADC